jgi:hypothetical protein
LRSTFLRELGHLLLPPTLFFCPLFHAIRTLLQIGDPLLMLGLFQQLYILVVFFHSIHSNACAQLHFPQALSRLLVKPVLMVTCKLRWICKLCVHGIVLWRGAQLQLQLKLLLLYLAQQFVATRMFSHRNWWAPRRQPQRRLAQALQKRLRLGDHPDLSFGCSTGVVKRCELVGSLGVLLCQRPGVSIVVFL